ncbi:hypothetical protein NE865_08307 [Phthorimaea operculella]|nr:hypothetical protein NE865_08307 [Phthorimaea operculella]
MTKLLKHICAGDNTANKNDRATGSMNAQLVCVNATSPRQPTTPQLLKILEQTIQKKIPEHMYKMKKTKDPERLRLAFNIPQKIADNLFQYRTKFVQHMLTSSMYANSTIGKPWEVVGSISEQIIDEILMQCAEEMQLKPYIMELYKTETQTQ